jgi:hypothetical protein
MPLRRAAVKGVRYRHRFRTEAFELTWLGRLHDPETANPSPPPLPQSYGDPLERKISELHAWSVGEGLRGTEAAPLFDSLCQRLGIAGVPFAGRWNNPLL